MRQVGLGKLLVALFSAVAKADPGALTSITSNERSHLSGRPWPNFEKLAQLYAEVLPQAMELYSRHRPHSS